MTDEQYRCYEVLCALYRGDHHLHTPDVKSCGFGIEYVAEVGISFATYDFDLLTEAVVLAHDRCVRVAVMPHSTRTLKWTLHPRSREGGSNAYHPTMEEALGSIRLRFPGAESKPNQPEGGSHV